MRALHLHAEDLSPGTTAPAWHWGTVTLTSIVRYAGASGDFTPIHHDPAEAAAVGLDRVFAMGMLTGGLLGHYAADWLEGPRVRRFTIRYHDKTWVGDQLHLEGVVAQAPDPELVDVELRAVSEDGRLIARAWASGAIPPHDACGACVPESGGGR